MKKIFKQYLPKNLLNLRHLFYAGLGSILYRRPSRELLVIGVTGTSGKSSTIHIIRQLLESCGLKVGALTTIGFYLPGKSKLNDQKMTMLGKTQIQKYLRKMAQKKCVVAVLEVTSEGVVQHRHRFINFDIAVLTNLYPEHIESHGGFENYKRAKLDFFKYVASSTRKQIKSLALPIKNPIKKTVIVNGNNEHGCEFLLPDFDKSTVFARDDQNRFTTCVDELILADKIKADKKGLHFSVNQNLINVNMYGEHNVMNILAALCAVKAVNLNWKKLLSALQNLKGIPGRIEFIKQAKKKGFQVIVDYAFEPVALEGLYQVARLLEPNRIIHVCGATGGGRDKSRRRPIGRLVGKNADIFIITDEDPYDEDPQRIMEQVAAGAKEAGKQEGKDLMRIIDRGQAIYRAIEMARPGDLVLITGKGSEQAMCRAGGKMVKWDDRKIARQAIERK